jgi:hypothetical protein
MLALEAVIASGSSNPLFQRGALAGTLFNPKTVPPVVW